MNPFLVVVGAVAVACFVFAAVQAYVIARDNRYEREIREAMEAMPEADDSFDVR